MIYVRSHYGQQEGTLAIVFLAKLLKNGKVEVSSYYPDKWVKFIARAKINEFNESRLKKALKEKNYINKGLYHSWYMIKIRYDSYKRNLSLIYASSILGVMLLFYLPWFYAIKKQKKDKKYIDKFYHLEYHFSFDSDLYLIFGSISFCIIFSFLFGALGFLFYLTAGYMLARIASYYMAIVTMKREANTVSTGIINAIPANSCNDLNLAEAKFLLSLKTDTNPLLIKNSSYLMKNLLFDWGQLGIIELFKINHVLYVKKGRKEANSNDIHLPHIEPDTSMEKFIDTLYLMGKNSDIGFKKYVIAKSLLKKGLLVPKEWKLSIWVLTEKGKSILQELIQEVQKQNDIQKREQPSIHSLLENIQSLFTLLTSEYQRKIIGEIKLSTKAKKKPKSYTTHNYEEYPNNFFFDMAYAPFEEMSNSSGKTYMDYYDSDSGGFDYNALPDTSSHSSGGVGYDSSSYDGSGYDSSGNDGGDGGE